MKHKLVNCGNYYNEESLNELAAILERGEGAGIHIDCIGHSRTALETEAYVEALKERYGDKLEADTKATWHTVYRLKK